MNELILWLKEREYFWQSPYLFANCSTIGCGGFSALAVYPKTKEELGALLRRLKSAKIDYYILGNLSNVLPPPKMSSRVVVSTKRLTQIAPISGGVYAQAGVTSGALLRYCKQNGKSGVEFLTGIPCTLGGALYMNAGVNGAHMQDIVQAVDVFYQGKLVSWQLNECEYAYKSSRFMKEDCAIVGARLKLLDATVEEVACRIKSYDERRAHLPKGKSMGCVFKNLNGESAGKWIEGAGLKGMAIGGAYVSKEHANFIINSGSATVEDICALIRLIKNAVFAQYKVQLQEEIVVLNE